MDISEKYNTYIEDIEYIQNLITEGGCLEMHSLGYWLKDAEGEIIGNVSDPITSYYRSTYGKKRIVNYKGEEF